MTSWFEEGAEEVIETMECHAGFSAWWRVLDPDIQECILKGIAQVIEHSEMVTAKAIITVMKSAAGFERLWSASPEQARGELTEEIAGVVARNFLHKPV